VLPAQADPEFAGPGCSPRLEGRLVVDKALFAWDIDSSKNVIPRGLLINTEGGTTQQAS
jgi:hypothetical protein